MTLTTRCAPLLGAVVGAGVVNAALRLSLDGPAGAEVVVATAMVGAVVLSGYRQLRPPARRRCRRVVLVTGAAAAASACLGGLALAQARPALERGVDAASEALVAGRSADSGAAGNRFVAAGVDFRQAGRAVDAWWARPARAIPVVSQHLRAFDLVASTGIGLAATGRSIAAATDLGGIRVVDGRIPLDRIAGLAQPLATASAAVSQAAARLATAGSPWLAPPVRDRLAASLARLTAVDRSLRNARELVSVLPAMLGGDGPRRWFLAIQTPSESRGSGGIIGNYGEITADRGRLQLSRFGRIGELNRSGDAPPRVLRGPDDYLSRYQRFDVGSIWQNVTMSPDFPSVATVIAGLYPQSGGVSVDGVIAIDPVGVGALLRLTGPISVVGWPVPITAETAGRVLGIEQYSLPLDDRIDFLGDVTQALFERLTTGELAAAPQILDQLGPAVAGKHLLFAAVDHAEAAVVERLGVNGAMAAVRGDALGVIVQNGGGNKIDWFLRRSVDYRPEVDTTTGALSARLTVSLENEAPATGLPDYVIGNLVQPPLPLGTNRLYFSVYTPWNLAAARVDGTAISVESEQELGRHVYSTYLDVPPGGRVVVEMDLRGVLALPAQDYRLDLHAQPLIEPDRVTVALPSGRTEHLVLDRDRTLRSDRRDLRAR